MTGSGHGSPITRLLAGEGFVKSEIWAHLVRELTRGSAGPTRTRSVPEQAIAALLGLNSAAHQARAHG
jgi:hypothetical protein